MKIGIISFAHMHAASYAACLNQLDGAQLAGIYDEDTSRGQEMAATYSTVYFDNLDKFFIQNLDGVIICSENVHHQKFVVQAAEHVKHILCEKPIATTLEAAQAMIDTCNQHGAKLQIAFPVRFAPSVEGLKKMLDEGALGKMMAVSCTNHGFLPGSWFVQKELSGGGAVIDHTVHVIDLLRWFWNTEVTEVYAEVRDGLFYPDLNADDAGLLSFTLANGVYGTLDTSWSRLASYPIWGDVKLELLGEDGIAKVDVFSQNLSLHSETQGAKLLGWGSNPDMGLVKDFLDMIATKREPSITGRDGLKALEVALAAYESSRTKQPVQLNQG